MYTTHTLSQVWYLCLYPVLSGSTTVVVYSVCANPLLCANPAAAILKTNASYFGTIVQTCHFPIVVHAFQFALGTTFTKISPYSIQRHLKLITGWCDGKRNQLHCDTFNGGQASLRKLRGGRRGQYVQHTFHVPQFVTQLCTVMDAQFHCLNVGAFQPTDGFLVSFFDPRSMQPINGVGKVQRKIIVLLFVVLVRGGLVGVVCGCGCGCGW